MAKIIEITFAFGSLSPFWESFESSIGFVFLIEFRLIKVIKTKIMVKIISPKTNLEKFIESFISVWIFKIFATKFIKRGPKRIVKNVPIIKVKIPRIKFSIIKIFLKDFLSIPSPYKSPNSL